VSFRWPAFFVAGYTGVLFMVSGGSTGAAAIALVRAWRKMTSNVSFEQLEAFDCVAMIGELVLIVLLIIAAGRFAAPLLSGPYALTFWGRTVVGVSLYRWRSTGTPGVRAWHGAIG
jgi:formate-dependent nitrite reductase membrane component NrfD